MAKLYERGRQRDAEARARLVPLAPGERPRALTVGASVALALAVANVAAAVAGADVAGDRGSATVFVAVSTSILVVAAVGMLRVRYWAVLGFQALLGIQILGLSLALLRVEKWWVGVIVAVAIGLLGLLFFKLVRAMARIQMPAR